jgi:hypothetical protein
MTELIIRKKLEGRVEDAELERILKEYQNESR